MIIIFKGFICLILFYLSIFCITAIVVKIIDKYRLFKLDKIKEENELKQRPVLKTKENKQVNKKYNQSLGIWEIENE